MAALGETMVDKSVIISEMESGNYSHADLIAIEKVLIEAKRKALVKERGEKAAVREAEKEAKAAEKTEKVSVKTEGVLTKHDIDIGDMVEFTFNKEKVVGKIRKVNEKSVVVFFHKNYRGVEGDVEQRVDMVKVLRNLSAEDRASKVVAA